MRWALDKNKMKWNILFVFDSCDAIDENIIPHVVSFVLFLDVFALLLSAYCYSSFTHIFKAVPWYWGNHSIAPEDINIVNDAWDLMYICNG